MAATRVLLTGELIEEILQHVDMQTILVSAQRVCRKWNATVTCSHRIQRLLFFEPLPEAEPHPSDDAAGPSMEVNPLLLRHFWFLFASDDQWSGSSPEKPLRTPINLDAMVFDEWNAKPSIASGDRRDNESFAEPSASWRRMLVSQPPPRKVGYIKEYGHLARMGPSQHYIITLPDGLRMGLLWDSIYSLIMEQRHEWETTPFWLAWRHVVHGARFLKNVPFRPGWSSAVDIVIAEVSRHCRFISESYPLKRQAWLYRSKAYIRGLSVVLRDMAEEVTPVSFYPMRPVYRPGNTDGFPGANPDYTFVFTEP